jgi:hypothetical protein
VCVAWRSAEPFSILRSIKGKTCSTRQAIQSASGLANQVDSVSKWTGESRESSIDKGFGERVQSTRGSVNAKKAQSRSDQESVQSASGPVYTNQVQSASGPVNTKKAQSRSDQVKRSIDKRIGGRTSRRKERVQSAIGSVNERSSQGA